MSTIEKSVSFTWEETYPLLKNDIHNYKLERDQKGKKFIEMNNGVISYEFIPPFIHAANNQTPEDYLFYFPQEPGKHLVLLIQAGAAALGIWENLELREHKVITKYMVRKKRGKAQMTYLKTKGKSRAGSRIRLRKGREFLIEIHEKLWEWKDAITHCDQLFYSCPIRLWSEFFLAKTPMFLERKDERWKKIPLDVRTPRFKELNHIYYVMSHGTIHYYSK